MSIEYGDKSDILRTGTRTAQVPIRKLDGSLEYVEKTVDDRQVMLKTPYPPSERPTAKNDGLSYYRYRQGGEKGFTQWWMNGSHEERALHFDVLYELGKWWSGTPTSLAMIGGGVFAMPVIFNLLGFRTKHVFEMNPLVKEWNEYRNPTRVQGWNWFMGDYRTELASRPDSSYDVIFYDADEKDPDVDLMNQKLKPNGILLGAI